MSDLPWWLIYLFLNLIAPLYGPPTFKFVPNEGPLPNEDESWHLSRKGYLLDCLHGTEWPLESSLGPEGFTAWKQLEHHCSLKTLYRLMTAEPYTVSVFVAINNVSLADLLATMNTIHKHWNPKRKGLFVFRFAWCGPAVVPPAPIQPPAE
jgi:hypothetical protein